VKKITYIDLFAGCGGLSLGFKKLGFVCKYANESNADAAQSYKLNFPESKLDIRDCKEVYQDLFFNKVIKAQKTYKCDVLAGGPPCQGFSEINRHRSPLDPRNSLVDLFLLFALKIQPKIILMENVTGLLTLESGRALKSVLNELLLNNYMPKIGIIQAGNFGLPQNRWRVFVLAKHGKIKADLNFPQPTHEFHSTSFVGLPQWREYVISTNNCKESLFNKGPLLPETTVDDAIGDLPGEIVSNLNLATSYERAPSGSFQKELRGKSDFVWDHISPKVEAVTSKRISFIPEGGNWTNLPTELQPKNLVSFKKEVGAFRGRYGRLHRKKTFPTIVTKPEPYWGRYIHPIFDRLVSIRECARAQGFPDSFRFYGAIASRYRQIGNAVPPPLSTAFASEIKKALKH